LTVPVLVSGAGGLREVAPGSAEYYDLRIKDRFHLDGGQLRPGTVLRGRILQQVDGSHLLLRQQVLRQDGPSGGTYSAWLDDREWLVTVESAAAWAVGQTVEWLVAQGRGATCRLADGQELVVRSGRKVTGATFEQYLAAAPPAAPASAPVGAVVSFQMQPSREEADAQFRAEAARLRATPEGQRIAREIAEEKRQQAAFEAQRQATTAARGPRVTGTLTPIFSTSALPADPATNSAMRNPR
jgi:hypothetical protein